MLWCLMPAPSAGVTAQLAPAAAAAATPYLALVWCAGAAGAGRPPHSGVGQLQQSCHEGLRGECSIPACVLAQVSDLQQEGQAHLVGSRTSPQSWLYSISNHPCLEPVNLVVFVQPGQPPRATLECMPHLQTCRSLVNACLHLPAPAQYSKQPQPACTWGFSHTKRLSVLLGLYRSWSPSPSP
jgi:hypothetical protein